MHSTERLSPDDLPYASQLLKQGSLVAFPTETVYGLGACIFNEGAIRAIFKAKGRPSDNPLIAHVSSFDQVEQIAQEIPPFFYLLAEQFFPGPLTIVLKRRLKVPSIVSAGLDSIALRMPSHPIAKELISLVGEPLVAPSANLSGKPSSTHSDHVLEDLDGKIAAVIEGGNTEIGIESTVISLMGQQPILLRPGAIGQELIEQVLGCFVEIATLKPQEPVLSPGMKYRHYAPKTPIRVFQTSEELQAYHAAKAHLMQRMLLSREPPFIQVPQLDHYVLSAHAFYSLLRLSDSQGYHEILILCDSVVQKDSALMNRVLRAAGA